MTLIVGILCSDGVVVAADGAATLGALGNSTVRQEIRKLDIISGKIIVGVSGPVGLGQKLKDKIGKQWSDGAFRTLDKVDVSSKISEGMREHIVPLLQTAQFAVPVVGNNIAGSSALSASIVAMIVKREPTLMQFDFQGASELANEDIPFIAVGSGQALADPFLAFIRRIFWKDHLPNLNEGIFAALWTVKQAIAVNPGGVADPIQVAVLTKENDGSAIELDSSEFGEHFESIKAAENKLATYKDEISSRSSAEVIPSPEDGEAEV